MATISNTPRPGYVWDATDNCWYPIGTGPHSHADYITAGSAINPNIVDAKGDIIAATAADTVARLAVGSNDQVLTADSSTATGLKWATPAAGGMTELASGTLSGTAVNLTSISQSYIDLYLVVIGAYMNVTTQLSYRFNSDSGSVYSMNFMYVDGTTLATEYGQTAMYVTRNNYGTSSNNNSSILYIKNYATTSGKDITGAFANDHPTGANAFKMFGNYGSTTAISSISMRTLNGTSTFSGGTYKLYGVK